MQFPEPLCFFGLHMNIHRKTSDEHTGRGEIRLQSALSSASRIPRVPLLDYVPCLSLRRAASAPRTLSPSFSVRRSLLSWRQAQRGIFSEMLPTFPVYARTIFAVHRSAQRPSSKHPLSPLLLSFLAATHGPPARAIHPLFQLFHTLSLRAPSFTSP